MHSVHVQHCCAISCRVDTVVRAPQYRPGPTDATQVQFQTQFSTPLRAFSLIHVYTCNVSKVDPSILKANRFLFLLRREKSTASVISCNRAEVTTAEVQNSQETGRLCPGFLLVKGDPIRQSVIWPLKRKKTFVYFP